MKKALVSLISITICLFIAQIAYSSMLVGDGKEIRTIDGEITAVEGATALLSEQVASASSLLTIGQKALSMGFTQKPQVMTIHQDQFVASLVPVQ